MKLIMLFTLLSFSLVLPTLALAELTLGTGFHATTFSGDGEKGTQMYLPISGSTSLGDLFLKAQTAYVKTSYDPGPGSSESLSTLTDTKVNASYAFVDQLPVDLLVGLDLNLPTGKTNLDAQELTLILDSDLVPITSYGEGFNINPTLSLLKRWQQLTLGAGIGYLLRGEYDYSVEAKNYDPGDALSFTTQLQYHLNQQWTLKAQGEYTRFGTDQLNGKDYLEQGDYLLFGLGARQQTDSWLNSINLRYTYRDNSKISNGNGQLVTEQDNIQGAEIALDYNTRYNLSERTRLSGSARYLHVAENEYASSSSYYVGEKTKASLGLGIARTLSDIFEASLGVEGFILTADRNPYHPTEDRSYTGGSLDLWLTARF